MGDWQRKSKCFLDDECEVDSILDLDDEDSGYSDSVFEIEDPGSKYNRKRKTEQPQQNVAADEMIYWNDEEEKDALSSVKNGVLTTDSVTCVPFDLRSVIMQDDFDFYAGSDESDILWVAVDPGFQNCGIVHCQPQMRFINADTLDLMDLPKKSRKSLLSPMFEEGSVASIIAMSAVIQDDLDRTMLILRGLGRTPKRLALIVETQYCKMGNNTLFLRLKTLQTRIEMIFIEYATNKNLLVHIERVSRNSILADWAQKDTLSENLLFLARKYDIAPYARHPDTSMARWVSKFDSLAKSHSESKKSRQLRLLRDLYRLSEGFKNKGEGVKGVMEVLPPLYPEDQHTADALAALYTLFLRRKCSSSYVVTGAVRE
jgi:hypothetical protein